MPKSGGLQDVSQRVDLDASRYVKGADETVIAAIRMAEANDKARKSFDELGEMQFKIVAALAGTEGQLHRLIGVQKEFDALGTSVQAYAEKVRGLANGYEFLAAASERQAEQQQDITKIAVASIGIQKKAQEEYYETIARVAEASKNIQMTALGQVAAEQKALHEDIARVVQASKNIQVAAIREVLAEQDNLMSATDAVSKAADISLSSYRRNLQAITREAAQAETGIRRLASAAPLRDVVSASSVAAHAGAAQSAAEAARLRVAASVPDRAGFIQTVRDAAREAVGVVTSGRRTPDDWTPPALVTRNSALGGSYLRAFGGGLNQPVPSGDDILGPNTAKALKAMDESRRFSSVIPGLLAGGGLAAIAGMAGRPDMLRNLGDDIRTAARGIAVATAAVTGGAGAGIVRAGQGVGDFVRRAGGVGGIAGNLATGIAGVGGAAFGAVSGLGGAIGGAMRGGPTAAETSAVVGGFIRRWYPAAHWAMMLTNELLATVGPATVAAGMGGLVGVQGFEQLIPRGKATFNTAESLGGSLGKTTGQAWGLKTALLQNAQDLATGSAAQIAGAGINIVNHGAGGPFVQMGLNTTSMIDRFTATLTQDFTKGGLGEKLAGAVTGGTGYLQQIGDFAANLGKIFLNLAPNLPGVGGDLMSVLSGGTGAIARTTGWAGGMMGPILSLEAGARWGPTLLGGAAHLAGRIPGGLGGTVGRLATAADVGATLNPATGAVVGAEGERIGGTRLAGALGGLGAWQIGGIAAATYMLNKGYTYQNSQQQLANNLLQNVGQQGIVAGLPSIIAGMQKMAGTSASDNQGTGGLTNMAQGFGGIFGGIRHLKPSEIWHGITQEIHGGWQQFGGRGRDPGNFAVAQQALQSLSQTMVDSLGTGAQIQQQWKGLSGESIDMGKSFDVATMAQLQLGSAFEKNGKLTSQAKTMIGNLYAGYAPMQMNTGQFGAAVGAQTAMAGLQHSQVAAVNAASDQLIQLVTGGAAGAGSFFSTLGGAQVTSKQGGIQLQAPPAFKAFAKALTSFTSVGGAGAWNVLTNSQNGLIPQLGNQTDWLRSMQTMGALSPGQTTQMTAFQMQQLLPMMRKSPAGLAMLSTIGQEFGGPAYQPGLSQAQNFKNIAEWTGKFAENAKAYNRNMNEGTVAASNIPRDAQQFVQQIGSNIAGDMAQGIATHGASLQDAFMNSYHGTKGGRGPGYDLQSLEKYGTFLAGAGVPKQGAVDMAKYAAQLAGAGPGIQSMVAKQMGNLYAKLKVQADISQARAQIQSLTHMTSSPRITVKANTSAIQSAINSIKGKDIPVAVKAQGISAIQSAIDSLHGKTITITTINRLITQVIGMGTAPGGVAPATLAGGPANMRLRAGAQSGMKVPGYGGGDIFPAMLEPGELVVPKHLTGLVAPILGGKIPGFQNGGGFGVMGFETMLQEAFHGEAVQSTMRQILDGIVGVEIQKFPRGMQFSPNISITNPAGGPRGGTPVRDPLTGGLPDPLVRPGSPHGTALGLRFSVEVLKGLTEGIKNAKGAAKTAAAAMMNHIAREIQYAKSTATNLTQGLNFGGMDTTQGPVQTQMKSYADSLKTFSGDIKSMTKGGLNKDLLKQMIAAGPVQGDLLAQSISQGPGGIKAVNQLYSQIQKMSKGIAGQGASAIYGGHLNPDLKSGTFVNNNVSINVSMGGGSGDLSSLSTKDLNALVAKIQAALLKQAKRNRKTGIALPQKSA